jgi:uncharacterized protein YunC (DUF1805 family)
MTNERSSQNIDSLTTGKASIAEVAGRASKVGGSTQSVSDNTITQVALDAVEVESSAADVVEVDLANNKIIIKEDGDYLVSGAVRYNDNANWSSGDPLEARVDVAGQIEAVQNLPSVASPTTYMTPQATAIVTVSSSPVDVILEAFQNSGASAGVASSRQDTHLNVGRLG